MLNNIAIVILAAGKASRMGSIKQLLPYKKTTLLEHAIHNAIASQAQKVYCVLGANAEKIKKAIVCNEVTTIVNPNWEKGLSSSIETAVRYLQNIPNVPEAILFVLADQPFITPNYLNEFITTYTKNNKYIVASLYEQKKGVPALFPKKYFSELTQLKGDKGAGEYLNNQTTPVIPLSSKSILLDIDTPEDYEQLLNK